MCNPSENVLSSSSSSSSSSSPSAQNDVTNNSNDTIPLLMQRLIDANVPSNEIFFRADQHHPNNHHHNHHHNRKDNDANANDNDDDIVVIEIKTLVWEVVNAASSLSEATRKETVDPFYVVTALPMNKKVNTTQLRQLIRTMNQDPKIALLEFLNNHHHHHQQQQQQPSSSSSPFLELKINMASLPMAEERTGYASGCMPPIGHTIPGVLFVDQSIVEAAETTPKRVLASIGSGIPGQSLLLPLEQFIQVAKTTSTHFYIDSLTHSTTGPDTITNTNTNSSSNNTNSDTSSDNHSLSVRDNNNDNPHQWRQQLKKERIERQPKPLDRLQEYRKFQNRHDKAKLFKSTARRKGGFNDVKLLVQEAVQQKEFADMLQTYPKHNLDKNAIHMAAWRGDLESVQLLLETAQNVCPELDAVNIISKGEGNYGKTAIFYALTQCRQDVVRYLLEEHHASLLFVNNKGQTPCSIAVSHFDESFCAEMYHREAQQLRVSSVGFADYRKSHSDHLFYGDLDPRFPIDNHNFGNDLAEPLNEFQRSVERADPATIIHGVPTVFVPRSLRPTVRWWNRKDSSLENANSDTANDQITFTQPRAIKKKNKAEQQEYTTKPRRQSSFPLRDELPDVGDIQQLERLTLDDVLGNAPNDFKIRLVNCSGSIRQLERDIDEAIEALKAKSDKSPNKTLPSKDATLVESSWGLDCEWKPGRECGKDSPVATLQLGTHQKAFLIDVQSICQATSSLEGATQIEPTVLEKQLNSTLSKLFRHPELPLLGFGVMQDLGKLAASYPHLLCFSEYSSVMDLQGVASTVYPKGSRPALSSLQKMVAILMTKRLDKTEQCSNWTVRPLSDSQIDYAALDAAVLPKLLQIMVQKSTTIKRYNGQFFSVHCNLQSNLRYLFLEDIIDKQDPSEANNDDKVVWKVPMGSVRQTLGKAVARQCWPSSQADPGIPIRQQFQPHRMTKKERAHLAKVGPQGVEKPKPIQLHTLTGNLDNLPMPGISLGYTKDSCAFRVVGHEFMNTLPEGTHVGFNRRSGVVETANAWLIFCNFGGSLTKNIQIGRQSSEFTDEGRFLSFQVNPKKQNGRTSEKTLMDYVASRRGLKGDENEKTLLLFAREDSKTKFMYCGSCCCKQYVEKADGRVDLVLELLDFKALVGEERISLNFVDLVERRREMYECVTPHA